MRMMGMSDSQTCSLLCTNISWCIIKVHNSSLSTSAMSFLNCIKVVN